MRRSMSSAFLFSTYSVIFSCHLGINSMTEVNTIKPSSQFIESAKYLLMPIANYFISIS